MMMNNSNLSQTLIPCRYGFTVMSNVVVYSVAWLVLGLDGTQGAIAPQDASKFRVCWGLFCHSRVKGGTGSFCCHSFLKTPTQQLLTPVF